MKVLFVDDDEMLRELAVAFFDFKKFEVELASNGKEALDKALGENFDLIMSDVDMPVMDGISFLSKCRERGITTFFISVSGKGRYREQALRNGADHFLTKPYKLFDLMTILEQATVCC